MTYGAITRDFDTMDEDTRKRTIRDYIQRLIFNDRGVEELCSLFNMELRKAKSISEESIYYLDLLHTDGKEGEMFRNAKSTPQKERPYRFNEFRNQFASDLL
jgi:hypothetical protein